jgi:transcription elongation factor GreA
MMTNSHTLTKKAFERLQKKLSSLHNKRDEMVVELEETRKLGDLAENSAYHELKNQLQILENQIAELEELLANAQITEKLSNGNQAVGLGSIISISCGGKKKILEIVSDGEANPLEGKISYSSPIAQALLGKKKGDKVEIKTPKGPCVYEILSVEN